MSTYTKTYHVVISTAISAMKKRRTAIILSISVDFCRETGTVQQSNASESVLYNLFIYKLKSGHVYDVINFTKLISCQEK